MRSRPQPNFLIVVTLKEVDPADYDWHSGLQLPTATGWIGPITPPSQPMVGWTVEPATVKDAGGIDRRPAIKISCRAGYGRCRTRVGASPAKGDRRYRLR